MPEENLNKIEIPRKLRTDLFIPAVTAIYAAMGEVKKMGYDERLTEAIVMLNNAKNLVADVLDERIINRYTHPEMIEQKRTNSAISLPSNFNPGAFKPNIELLRTLCEELKEKHSRFASLVIEAFEEVATYVRTSQSKNPES